MSDFLPDGPRRLAVNLALVTVGGVGAWKGATGFLAGQARTARKVIPKPEGVPYQGDGIYRPGATEPEAWRFDSRYDLHMMIFGDSLAAGLGVDRTSALPGVLLARSLAEESGTSVRLSVKAIAGATSKGLAAQIDAVRIAGGRPDVSVILVGGNDVTARNGIVPSARRLGRAVERLVDAGSEVVVGTCPDLGAIQPVPQPLRSVMQGLSLQLAAAQKARVTRAGGTPVSIAQSLSPELRARPDEYFSEDRFHPNSAGYELAAGLLLPAVFRVLGIWDGSDDERAGAPPPEAEPRAQSAPTDDAPDEGIATDADDDRQPVLRRVTHRLLTFVRDHENDVPEAGESSGHTVDGDSAVDHEQAREAAETLQRRSRILRGYGDAG